MKNLWEKKSALIIKLWINQIAFSLFGLFVASPFSGTLCALAGVFSILFYLSVVAFAVIDDAQRDKIAFDAGRAPDNTACGGARYLTVAFAPSVLISLIHLVLKLCGNAASAFRAVLYFVQRFLLAGEVLGIDAGLTQYRYDEISQMRVSDAPASVQFMSEAGLFQLLFLLVSFAVLTLVYSLTYRGVIRLKTSGDRKQK